MMPNSSNKVLVFHPAIAPYRVDFFNQLNRKFHVDFFMEHHNVKDQKFDQQVLSGLLEFEPKYLNSGFNVVGRSVRFGIFSILKKYKPRMVLCSEFGQITLFVILYNWLSRRKITIYTLSDDSLESAKSRSGMRSVLRKFVSRNIDGIIFPSSEVGNWFSANVSSRIKLFELPIIHEDVVFRKRLEESLEQSRKDCLQYGLLDSKVILFVGRLAKEKNIPALIQAISAVKRHDWKLVIVGSGDQQEQLIREIKNLGLVGKMILTGRKEGKELYSWYNIAELFVLPSLHEPFGAVVNEALLGGCRVLCSELAGASTLINEENGELFDPNNILGLTMKLEANLDNLEPVSETTGTVLRNSRMPFTFDEKIERLLNAL